MANMHMIRICAALLLVVFPATRPAWAQDIGYGLAGRDATSINGADIAGIARQALAAQQGDSRLGAEHRGALLLAARQDIPAAEAIGDLTCKPSPDPADARTCFLSAFAHARRESILSGVAFDPALRHALARGIGALDDVAAERIFAWLRARDIQAKREVDSMLARLAGTERISVDNAISLAQAWVTFEAAQTAKPVTDAFVWQERARRYNTDEAILIPTPQGASLAATLVRPKNAPRKLPTAMWFTIYSDPARNLEIAATAAAHGYAGIVVNARGKLQSPDVIRPYEVEVDDTADAIVWTSQQAWSDGRVGMYGGSYTGFAAWAATKRLPDALKTIVPYVAAIPGQGLPMENNVFLNANYGWPFYVTNNRTLDRETYNDPQRWYRLNDQWFQSGRRYRDIDQIDGTPNPWLQRWLQHPDYDGYWQSMVPYGEDFTKIDMPVLTITGYYDDGQISALRYLSEHYRFKPDAKHYLVIGPYDHFGAQQPFKEGNLRGYAIDPIAQFDTTELTFAWFDHVFHGKERPPLVKDRINYQVMGANIWRHAPSLDAMHTASWNFYLTDDSENGRYRLSRNRPDQVNSMQQTVAFFDRATTGAGYYPNPIVDAHPDLSKGLVFQTQPLDQELEVSGAFSGVLRARINKRDFDFMAALYELRADGSAMALSYYVGRASYAKDISTRELLTPGALSVLPFERTRVVSRRVAAGSRLALVVDVLKNGFHQVNYGTGGDVSDESVADAAEPLQVDWQTDSFVRIPISIVAGEN